MIVYCSMYVYDDQTVHSHVAAAAIHHIECACRWNGSFASSRVQICCCAIVQIAHAPNAYTISLPIIMLSTIYTSRQHKQKFHSFLRRRLSPPVDRSCQPLGNANNTNTILSNAECPPKDSHFARYTHSKQYKSAGPFCNKYRSDDINWQFK